ncbi:MAG: ABC transporter substrate-binding protein [Abditibacteriota bacterium]|nr:ABC transporter substrate-binding protein [Abditibacteriota bacterium]
MKRLLFLTIAAMLLCGCGAVEENKTTEITIWHPWGGADKERFDRIVAEYNRTHDDIHVKALFTPNDTSNSQKFFTSVAADKGPDLIFVDTPQVGAWAYQGAIIPLDDYLKRDGLTKDDFFAPCWNGNRYHGQTWGLAYCADPNFAFVWNKKIFREVGLDPERPPRTMKELDEYNDKITKIDPKTGKIVRIGIIPWAQCGNVNSLYSWGWAFGGSFYDAENDKVTADDPKLVKALEWMCSYCDKYDVKRISAFSNGFGSRDQNPFYIGIVAMECLHLAWLQDIAEYAPNLDYGISYLPMPEGGEAKSSWIGGWNMGIPKSCKKKDEAWKVMKWFCADREGTRVSTKDQTIFPSYKKSAYFDNVPKDGPIAVFYDILLNCKHERPVQPAQEFYVSELGKAVDYAIYGTKTPKPALEDAREATQKELDLRLAGGK